MLEKVDLDLSIDLDRDRVRLACTGDLDMSTRDAFERAVAAALERSNRRLELDLSGVGFFGSDGVHALITASQMCADRGVQLTLKINPGIEKVLMITAVHHRFAITNDGDVRIRLDPEPAQVARPSEEPA